MKYILVIILIWLFVQQTSAQSTGRIHITLRDHHKEEMNYNLLLKRANDSTLVKLENGVANNEIVFEHVLYGDYFIEIMCLQKKVKRLDAIHVSQADNFFNEVDIEPINQSLKEVKVTAAKNILERKSDKLIYNVENTITSAADDALSVLQKAPGISVDQNGQISMRGKSGVLVMINGKMTFADGEQLSTLLKGTMANQIAKIEIISNPSSKYDANGNAGIVNIILKKDQRLGSNGSLTLSYGSGKYRKTNNSLNLNYNSKHVSVYASYNFVHNMGFNDLTLYRKFYTNGVYQGAYEQHNYLRFPAYYHIPKIGVDYKLNSKNTVGLMVNGLSNHHLSIADNKTFIENNQFQRQSYYITTNRSSDLWFNYGANLNYKHTFDSLGQELTMDADYIRYGNTVRQHFTTHYYDLQNAEIKIPYLLLGQVDGNLQIKALKADYVKPFHQHYKLECGLKSSIVKADNKLEFYDESNAQHVFDSNQSNHFIYQENINALYTSLTYDKETYSIQAGLRAEQTVATGHQIMNDNSFKRNYWQLFPTLFITRKFNQHHETGLSFSRRILRPTYQQLNPFKFFIDASTFNEGNPYLQPQNTYLIELNHTYNQQYQFTLSSGITNKSITEVLIPAEGQNNITIQTNKNVNKQYVQTLSVSAPFKFKKWWNSMFDASVYYSLYDGELAGQKIHSSTMSWNAKMSHTIILPQQINLQCDGFIQYAEHYSFYTSGTFGGVNVSLQKAIMHKKLSMKISANDIFYNSPIKGSSNFDNYHEDYYVKRDTRTIMLAFTYRFGNSSLSPSRRRTGGAEEEKQRAG